MGLVKKILSLKKIDKISTLYSDHLSIELAEDFHIHLRNIRIELDHHEFEKLCKSIIKSYIKWLVLAKPVTGDIDHVGKQIFLHQSHIEAEPGKGNMAIASDELRVELQKWADYIHLHYKGLRLEFTVDEFVEFADTVLEARQALFENVALDRMPKRVGKYHVACPRGRVKGSGNSDFWTDKNQDVHLDHRHKTIYFDAFDNHVKSADNINGNTVRNSSISNLIYKILDKSRLLSRLIGIRIS